MSDWLLDAPLESDSALISAHDVPLGEFRALNALLKAEQSDLRGGESGSAAPFKSDVILVSVLVGLDVIAANTLPNPWLACFFGNLFPDDN